LKQQGRVGCKSRAALRYYVSSIADYPNSTGENVTQSGTAPRSRLRLERLTLMNMKTVNNEMKNKSTTKG